MMDEGLHIYGQTQAEADARYRLATALPPDRAAKIPTGGLLDNFDRAAVSASTIATSNGTMRAQAIWVPAGLPISAINVRSGNAASSGLTHSYAAVYLPADADNIGGGLIVQSNDDTSAWSASTKRTFTLASPYTPSSSGFLLFGFTIVASTTVPTMEGRASLNNSGNVRPALYFAGNGSLTDGTAPSTLTASGTISGEAYVWLS